MHTKIQYEPVDCNVIQSIKINWYGFISYITTFKKLPPTEFWCNIKEEKLKLNKKCYYAEVHLHVGSDFLHITQPKHNKSNKEADIRIQLSSIKLDRKDLQKCKIMSFSLLFWKTQFFKNILSILRWNEIVVI